MIFFNYFLGFVIFSLSIVNSELIQPNHSLFERFNIWIEDFEIKVIDDIQQAKLFTNWLHNDKLIYETNSKNLSYSLGHNSFSGMSTDEFLEYMKFKNNNMKFQSKHNNFLRKQQTFKQDDDIYSESLPISIDWREKGAVTNVKNQGNCGSCWSFSTTGALEGIYAITYGDLVSFSEQQLVDCDFGIIKNHGCNGGIMDDAFDWISSNGGLCSEEIYPYISGTTQKNGMCQNYCKLVSGSEIKKYIDVIPNSDNAMMNALVKQPVSVAVDATNFQFYKNGIFTGKCGTELNHGVLLVGYSTENDLDYYILKNSWDTTWGINGYMYLGKGLNPETNKSYNDGAGQCGVLSMASYPLLQVFN